MNIWECEKCNIRATGIGGAVGLLAIGWYFKRGDIGSGLDLIILCPRCHPKGYHEAEKQAEALQGLIGALVEVGTTINLVIDGEHVYSSELEGQDKGE